MGERAESRIPGERAAEDMPLWDAPRWAAPLGAAVLLVLVGGAVLLVLLLTGFFGGKVTAEERAACQELVVPAVLFDPAPFSSVEEADRAFLLSAGVWAALLGEEEPAEDGVGELLLPGERVRASCARLFGSGCTPSLATVMQQGVIFEYDPAGDAYHVPITGQIGLYEPRVGEIRKKGAKLYARVAYLSLDDFAAEGEERHPVKTMTYVLEKAGQSIYISGIEE